MQKTEEAVRFAEEVLESLNPETILKRGYSVVYTNGGKVLKKAEDARIGQHVAVKLWKGKLRTNVEEIEK